MTYIVSPSPTHRHFFPTSLLTILLLFCLVLLHHNSFTHANNRNIMASSPIIDNTIVFFDRVVCPQCTMLHRIQFDPIGAAEEDENSFLDYYEVDTIHVLLFDENTLETTLNQTVSLPDSYQRQRLSLEFSQPVEDPADFEAWYYQITLTLRPIQKVPPKNGIDIRINWRFYAYNQDDAYVYLQRPATLDYSGEEMNQGINHLTVTPTCLTLEQVWSWQLMLSLPQRWKPIAPESDSSSSSSSSSSQFDPSSPSPRGDLIGTISIETVGSWVFAPLNDNAATQFCLVNGHKLQLFSNLLDRPTAELILQPDGKAKTLIDNRIDPYLTIICPNIVLKPFCTHYHVDQSPDPTPDPTPMTILSKISSDTVPISTDFTQHLTKTTMTDQNDDGPEQKQQHASRFVPVSTPRMNHGSGISFNNLDHSAGVGMTIYIDRSDEDLMTITQNDDHYENADNKSENILSQHSPNTQTKHKRPKFVKNITSSKFQPHLINGKKVYRPSRSFSHFSPNPLLTSPYSPSTFPSQSPISQSASPHSHPQSSPYNNNNLDFTPLDIDTENDEENDETDDDSRPQNRKMINLPIIAQTISMTIRYYRTTIGRESLSTFNTHYVTSIVPTVLLPLPQYQPRFLWKEDGLMYFHNHFEFQNDTLTSYSRDNLSLLKSDHLTLYLIFPNNTNPNLRREFDDVAARAIVLPKVSDDDNGVEDENYYYGNTIHQRFFDCSTALQNKDPIPAGKRCDLPIPPGVDNSKFHYFSFHLNAIDDIFTHTPERSHPYDKDAPVVTQGLDFGHILSSFSIDLTQRDIGDDHGTPYLLSSYQVGELKAYWLAKQPVKTKTLSGYFNVKEDEVKERFHLRLLEWSPPTGFQGSLGIRVFRQITVFHVLGRDACQVNEISSTNRDEVIGVVGSVVPVLYLDTHPSSVLNQPKPDVFDPEYYQYISFPIMGLEFEQGKSYSIVCTTLRLVMNSGISPYDTDNVDYLQITYDQRDEFVEIVKDEGSQKQQKQQKQQQQRQQQHQFSTQTSITPTMDTTTYSYIYTYDIFNPDDVTPVDRNQFSKHRPRPVSLRQTPDYTVIVDVSPTPYTPRAATPDGDPIYKELWFIITLTIICGSLALGLVLLLLSKFKQKLYKRWAKWQKLRHNEKVAEEMRQQDEVSLMNINEMMSPCSIARASPSTPSGGLSSITLSTTSSSLSSSSINGSPQVRPRLGSSQRSPSLSSSSHQSGCGPQTLNLSSSSRHPHSSSTKTIHMFSDQDLRTSGDTGGQDGDGNDSDDDFAKPTLFSPANRHSNNPNDITALTTLTELSNNHQHQHQKQQLSNYPQHQTYNPSHQQQHHSQHHSSRNHYTLPHHQRQSPPPPNLSQYRFLIDNGFQIGRNGDVYSSTGQIVAQIGDNGELYASNGNVLGGGNRHQEEQSQQQQPQQQQHQYQPHQQQQPQQLSQTNDYQNHHQNHHDEIIGHDSDGNGDIDNDSFNDNGSQMLDEYGVPMTMSSPGNARMAAPLGMYAERDYIQDDNNDQ